MKPEGTVVLEEELAPCPNVCEKTGAKALLEQVPCPFTIEEVYRQQSKSTTRYVYFWGVMDIGYKMLIRNRADRTPIF